MATRVSVAKRSMRRNASAKRIPSVYEDKMRVAFERFDLNKDGSLCGDEIMNVLTSLGHKPTKVDADMMFQNLDANGDGKISFDEFCDKWTELQLEGEGEEWNHAHSAWESCQLKFDGTVLNVNWNSHNSPCNRNKAMEMANGYDIYLEAATVVQDGNNAKIFHVNSMTSTHMFSFDDESVRQEWMARLTAAQDSGMTLLQRMQFVKKDKRRRTRSLSEKTVGNYVLGQELSGKTGFAEAVRCGYHNRTGEPVACKIMPNNVALDFKNEIVLQSMLRHPNIIALKHVLEQGRYVYVMMEIAHGGDLFARVSQANGLEESIARIYFRQLMTSIAYCHAHYVVHRDLKLENVMIANEGEQQVVKLIDFGFAKNVAISRVRKWKHWKGPGFDHLNCRAVIGTMKYVAPEMLEGEVYDGMKSDVWAAGVILYLMVNCSYPFNVGDNGGIGGQGQGKSHASMALKKQLDVATLRFDRRELPKTTKSFQHLLRNMLNKDPDKRYSFAQVLRDPWMLDADKQGKTWTKLSVEQLIERNASGEVIVPDKVSDDPSTWLQAYYENPVTKLPEVLDGITEEAPRGEGSGSAESDYSEPAGRFCCWCRPAPKKAAPYTTLPERSSVTKMSLDETASML